MKYHYFYQDKKNNDLDGWIEAKDRNDAYQKLKRQQIKPYKLIGKNPLAWKRWAAIAVLAVISAGLAVYALHTKRTVQTILLGANESHRDQLYGDPSTIQKISANGWRDTFADPGDAWLARHAIPGSGCDCKGATSLTNTLSTVKLSIAEGDSVELQKMKRMVNCMKSELEAYLSAGGTQLDYMKLCNERLAKELQLARRANNQFESIRQRDPQVSTQDSISEWERINSGLRAVGLPTVVIPTN